MDQCVCIFPLKQKSVSQANVSKTRFGVGTNSFFPRGDCVFKAPSKTQAVTEERVQWRRQWTECDRFLKRGDELFSSAGCSLEKPQAVMSERQRRFNFQHSIEFLFCVLEHPKVAKFHHCEQMNNFR